MEIQIITDKEVDIDMMFQLLRIMNSRITNLAKRVTELEKE